MRARMNRASELISHLRAARRGAARRTLRFTARDAAPKKEQEDRGVHRVLVINHEFRPLRHVARKRVRGTMIAIFFQFFFLFFSLSFRSPMECTLYQLRRSIDRVLTGKIDGTGNYY